MIRSFLTIAFRILWRNKVTSFVNVFSLGLGVTCFLFILLYVDHETSFDKFHENYENIYRLEGDNYARLPPVVGDYVKERIPEIRDVVHLSTHGLWDLTYLPEDNPEAMTYARTHVLWADSTTFNVFTFPFVQGSPATALYNPFTAVITEGTARTLFGTTDPMGKTIEFVNHKFEITGIIKDPNKSHLQIGAFVSMTSMPLVYPDRNLNITGPNSWLWSATYLLTAKDVNKEILESKINDVLSEINDGNLFNTIFTRFNIRPLRDIYFHGALQNLDYGLHGSFQRVVVLSVIGVFMLALAGINYVNLTTARSIIRMKEVAVKRFVGSSTGLVRLQLILESVIVALISLLVAVTAVQVFVAPFNNVAGVRIDLLQWNRLDVWLIAIGSVVILGVIAGIYPALYLTAVKPVRLVRHSVVVDSTTAISPRSILMTLQFTLSIILMICALAGSRQLHYLRNANLGFSKDHIIQVETPQNHIDEYSLRETFKEELLSQQNILGVSFAPGSPGSHIPTAPLDVKHEERSIEFLLVDHDYFKVMDIELVEGSGFFPRSLEEFATLSGNVRIVVNESFVRELNLTSPVGYVFQRVGPSGPRNYEVVGVVKDFHFRSLHHKISPIMFIQTRPMHLANIKVQPTELPATIEAIEGAWKKVYGDKLFTYTFLDDTFDQQYKNDEQLATVTIWFTCLTLVIACLGLFALSSFMITRRTKEIGIRKSLGASVKSIYRLLSWDFLKWIAMAVAVACPVGWYITSIWLGGFAYHVQLSADIFIIASVIAFLVALLTITWQSLKAASANPVDSLRTE
jgi:putative ABC transport system permease protein